MVNILELHRHHLDITAEAHPNAIFLYLDSRDSFVLINPLHVKKLVRQLF